ncbi:MAG: alpha/beta fold hydrolase [Lentisphaeria bacterium]|nr:alpha/beta fold hydrolase [Lentisphaeria bacterium]
MLQPVSDPLEGYNRTVQSLNSGVERYLIHPVSQVWTFLVHEIVQTGLSNFSENLDYPRRVVNHLLQGEFGYSWIDTKRFLTNTTVGVLGFMDPATKWGMPTIPGSFTDTFAKWGIGKGCYLNLPFLGPGTVRDAAGKLADFPLFIPQYLLGQYESTAIRTVLNGNEIARGETDLYSYFTTQYNDYELFKIATLLGRDADTQFKEITMPENPDPDESFGALLLVPKTLVVLLPGIGSHRQSGEAAALAELFRSADCDTLVISSTFTPDYFLNLPEMTPPGLLPKDAETLAKILDCVIADYQEHYRAPADQRLLLVGYSLGGLNALHLAAFFNKGGEPALHFERYLAINPPFDPMRALETIDDFAAIPANWPEEERAEMIQSIKDRMARWMNPAPFEKPSPIPPLSLEESHFILGLYMRLKLVSTIQALEKRNPTGVLKEDPQAFFHRNALFDEAFAFSYRDYLEKVIVPWYGEHGLKGKTKRELSDSCRLDSIGNELSSMNNIYVFQNSNDFLIKPDDLKWYRRVFGDRCTIFERGGHLGTMYRNDYQQAMLNALLK